MIMMIDVIVPVYKPDVKFDKLMKMLGMQSLLPSNILIANTVGDEDDSDRMAERVKKLLNNPSVNVLVTPIQKKDYDHALTRDAMAKKSKADAVVFMTQDAVPEDTELIKNLTKALEDGADAAFARQVANVDADVVEKHTRQFNYPEMSYIRTSEDFKTHGIKTIFCSDTCMMYKKETFDKFGGFGEKSMFAEDMTFAFKLLQNGGKLAYVSGARVLHSHNLTLKENYRRSLSLGKNQAAHPEIYKTLSSEKEGVKYVKFVSLRLLKQFRLIKLCYFFCTVVVRYMGVRKGRKLKTD